MIARFLLAALGAGLLAGLLVTPVQYARVVPLILHAEAYENGGAVGHDHHAASPLIAPAQAATLGRTFEEAPGLFGGSIVLAHSPADEDEGSAALVESRLLGTILANLVTGAGFALILAAASLLVAVPITAANGAVWGLIGFAVLQLAPAIGLAPELPAMPAGDLAGRQAWWIATVLLSSLGAYALILRPQPVLKAAGVFAILLPHVVGAPMPADLASPVPPTLAAEFAVASLATAAIFWTLLGFTAGHAFDRMRRSEPQLSRAA